MFETIILVVIFLATLTFLYLTENKRKRAEIERFREFVRATKSENVQEYVETEPAIKTEMPKEEKHDDYTQLEDFSPEDLLKKLKK